VPVDLGRLRSEPETRGGVRRGPDRRPGEAARRAGGIRKRRGRAEGAKGQLKDQLGPEYEDINWRQYDPRQYDPRRIVKEALLEPIDDAISPYATGAATPSAE